MYFYSTTLVEIHFQTFCTSTFGSLSAIDANTFDAFAQLQFEFQTCTTEYFYVFVTLFVTFTKEHEYLFPPPLVSKNK